MKVLVTGSHGYLGNVLVPLLEDRGIEVTSLDLGLFGNSITKVDLSKDWLGYHVSGQDAIIHLAGISNDPASELDPDLTATMNGIASFRLIESAVKYKIPKFVFISSASVYGKSEGLSSEESPTEPKSLYASSKLCTEMYLENTSDDMMKIILRFGTLFGPSEKMRFDLAVNLMVKDALTTGKINVFGGEQFRPFLHVEDAAGAILHSLKFNKSIKTNVLCENIKIIDLANLVSEYTQADVITLGESTDNRDYKLDMSRMFNVFGFTPKFSISDGILGNINWVLDHLDNLDNDIYYTLRMWKKYYKGISDG